MPRIPAETTAWILAFVLRCSIRLPRRSRASVRPPQFYVGNGILIEAAPLAPEVVNHRPIDIRRFQVVVITHAGASRAELYAEVGDGMKG
jgi:hypothetical protein